MKKVLIILGFASATLPLPALCQTYHRVATANMTPAPRLNSEDTIFAFNGYEAAPYAYGYGFNLPADGRWRFIEARCYNSADGKICIDGHYIRRSPGKCEEVSQHAERRGNYIRIIPAGRAETCR